MATSSDSTLSESPQSENLQPRYTPNPWSYDEDDARIYYDDGDVQPTIAYVERDGVAPEQVKTDGYLLTASPILLAACRLAAEDCRMALSGEWDKGDDGFRATLETLESAIAKASGGAHGYKQYTVSSSHGKLTADADGFVIDRDLENDEPDGGAHLACIVRFDIVEWRRFWNNPDTHVIDILDLGYWHADPSTYEKSYEPPNSKWRAEIAQQMFGRIPAERAAS